MKIEVVPLRLEHALVSYRWRNDAQVWEFTFSKPDKLITPEIETAWLEGVLKRTNERRYAILCDGAYIGNVYLTDITARDAQFHIFIGETEYWGKGIATTVTRIVLDKAKAMGLKHIWFLMKEKNLSVLVFSKKNGFVESEKNGDIIKMTLTL